MERKEDKQSSHKTPYTELEQVNSDFILAMSIQEEQDGASATLETIESESDEEMSESTFESDDEGGESNYDEEMELEMEMEMEMETEEEEDDEIDPDELSYEELIELGERIGEEQRGLSANEISSCLHPYTYHCQSSSENKSGIGIGIEIDRCVVCQVEYEKGETVVALQCKHPFHEDCITTWLQIKKVCPICTNEVSTPKIADKNDP